ncbi:hypothetical protein CAT7_05069 [Carnobacterium sp. AT7]|nr:hypothetical protein CAT7_05069 [Carnobacterium sp. AT7]
MAYLLWIHNSIKAISGQRLADKLAYKFKNKKGG